MTFLSPTCKDPANNFPLYPHQPADNHIPLIAGPLFQFNAGNHPEMSNMLHLKGVGDVAAHKLHMCVMWQEVQ